MKNKKAILNVLFLLIVFGLTLYYVFYGEDMAALAGYMASPMLYIGSQGLSV